ncbi:MAG: S9 family peptidase [candidate division WOR-3 bacterium]|nr:MAG: S9 family peptidase [candidate division WOR-3 bacterium]
MKRKTVDIPDLYKMRFLREIALSPDGKKVAYIVEWMDKKQNKYFSNLYVVTDDGKRHHFIRGNKDVKNPHWSPNGRYISFILNEKDKQNIWMIPADGGEAYAVTDAKGFFGQYRWTPDSKYIICEFLEKKEDKERVPEKDKPPLYYHIKNLWYKLDGKGMLPEEKNHIWKVNVKSGKMTQLTFGKNGDVSPAVSPDGKTIAFFSNRNENFEEKFLYIDLFVIDIDGKRERKIKTPAGPKDIPVFSPDGKYIAYIGREYPEEFVGWRNEYLWLVPRAGGKAVNLTKSFDRTFFSLVLDDLGNYARLCPLFSKDGRSLYFPLGDHGKANLYRIDTKKKKVEKVFDGNHVVYAFDYDGDNTFALAISDARDTGNLYLYKNVVHKLTNINRDYVKTHRISTPEEFWFKGYRGHKIQGWILKPPNFNEKKKYPFIVQIHGGPHAAYGNSFFHEFQTLAAHGYIVFYSNPHGSTTYGEPFAKTLHNQWGIPDMQDILKGVKILTRRSYIDKKRMGVMGGSYGGFMTNWIIGHTNIFKVAVTMRSVVNMLSFFSSDFGFSLPKEFKGNWWNKKAFQFYWNMSPIKYIKNIKTPLLIIHSEQDHRCPISQAEELFVALKLRKQDVEMVRFPLEPHGLSRHGSPRRREKRLKFILNWIDRYLKK